MGVNHGNDCKGFVKLCTNFNPEMPLSRTGINVVTAIDASEGRLVLSPSASLLLRLQSSRPLWGMRVRMQARDLFPPSAGSRRIS